MVFFNLGAPIPLATEVRGMVRVIAAEIRVHSVLEHGGRDGRMELKGRGLAGGWTGTQRLNPPSFAAPHSCREEWTWQIRGIPTTTREDPQPRLETASECLQSILLHFHVNFVVDH